MKPFFVSSLLGFLLAGSSLAQDAALSSDPLPPGPLLAPAPEFSHWVVTIKRIKGDPTAATPAKDAEPANYTCNSVRTKDVYYQEAMDSRGQKWKTWAVAGINVTVWPNGQVVPGGAGEPKIEADFRSCPFLGVSWVDASNFTGLATYKGRKAITFSKTDEVLVEGTVVVMPAAIDRDKPVPVAKLPTTSQKSVAVIDFETRLPLYAQIGNDSYTYEFRETPQGMVEVPAEVAAVMKEQAAAARNQ